MELAWRENIDPNSCIDPNNSIFWSKIWRATERMGAEWGQPNLECSCQFSASKLQKKDLRSISAFCFGKPNLLNETTLLSNWNTENIVSLFTLYPCLLCSSHVMFVFIFRSWWNTSVFCWFKNLDNTKDHSSEIRTFYLVKSNTGTFEDKIVTTLLRRTDATCWRNSIRQNKATVHSHKQTLFKDIQTSMTSSPWPVN